jgi:mono/diheme cytochrome c family protein
MSTPSPIDPRADRAAVTDDVLLESHEKLLGEQPDEKARYRLLPLALLFIFSGLIFFGGTYLGRYSGHFDPHIYNENARGGAGEQSKAAAPPAADPMVVGKASYTLVCASCHQPTGQGLPPAFPPLAGSEWVASEERAIRIVLYGLQGPIKVKGTEYNVAVMPATGPGSGFNLSAEKVAAVLTYVRKEWGNDFPPVSAAKVNEIRTKEGATRGPMTVAELEKLP